jgi:trehalose 6-phosphate phosphatase
LEHLLACWPEILKMIQTAKHILFLSDYDGTLTPIVEKPEFAILSVSNRAFLRELADCDGVTVGIISGRALIDLKEKVRVPGIVYAGNHGFEIEGPGWNFISPISEEIKPLYRVLRQVLSLTLGKIKGVFLEDKGFTISVHFRQVEEKNVNLVHQMVERVIQKPASRGLIKVTSGKKVYEVRPAIKWDKGKAIQLIMKKYGRGGRQSGMLPIYMGDDLTDEDGFRMIRKYGSGVTAYVGEPRTDFSAQYYLKSTEEVTQFMAKILEYFQRGS